MSLNYLLIWLAGVGGLFGFARTKNRPEAELRAIFVASVVTTVILAILLFLAPQIAGLVGVVPWLCGVVLPQVVLARTVARYERFQLSEGESIFTWTSFLPWMRWWLGPWSQLFVAERKIREGSQQEALQILQQVSQSTSIASLYGRARLLSLLEAWAELLAMSQEFVSTRSGKPSLFFSSMKTLSLGMLGHWEEAKKEIDALQEHFEPGSEERGQLLQILRRVVPEQYRHEIEGELSEEHAVAADKPRSHVVGILSAFLFLTYFIGQAIGSYQDRVMLAFEPFQILIFNEWWRLLTVAFVHDGFLHVGSNVLGIVILGPFLSRVLGPFRFLALFICSVIGASLFMLGLMWLSLLSPTVLVGASGGVMGIVGGYVAYYARNYFLSRSLYHQEELRRVALIVVLQTLFDLITPQVSFYAHFGGLLSGVFLFFILCPRDRSTERK